MEFQLSNPTLWEKISNFQLDDSPEAAVKFSDKLAKEEKWTGDFAKRAIAEYKKFLYLCLTMPQGASPSEVMDKVWHLHLTYTVSYWQKLCGEILQKQLHHYPNKGGEKENLRHQQWYADTLIAYVKEFQEIPPTDYWPLPSGLDLEIHLSPNSLFRKPTWQIPSLWQGKEYWPIGALALSILSLFMFSLSGPYFLLAYMVLIVWAYWGMYLKINFKKMVLQAATQQLHPYHFAAVFKDTETLFLTLVTDFAEKGWLHYQTGDKFVCDKHIHQPMMYSLQAYDEKDISANLLRDSLFSLAKTISKATLSLKEALSQGVWVNIFQWLVLLVGIVRVFQGILNGRPVIFLLLLLVFYVLVWIILSQSSLLDKDTQNSYQASEWGYDISTAALTFMLFNTTYTFADGPTLPHLFHKPPTSGDGVGWLGASFTSNAGSDTGTASCGSGGCGSGGCGGCGGCGGS